LDDKTLNSQRYEAWNILGVVQYPNALSGWVQDPAILMWLGYPGALKIYLRVVILEWASRGYPNSVPIPLLCGESIAWPPWLGDERLHSSHRSNLLRRNIQHYSQFNWPETPDNMYFWP